MNDMFFNLYEEPGGNAIQQIPAVVVTRTYQGAWLLVDNGYLAWPATVPPIKTTSSRVEIRFSVLAELMQKDVECTFFIPLKGQLRILQTGVHLSGVNLADKIFLPCCALHNWLLETDGFTNNWNNRIPAAYPSMQSSDWDGPLGQHDPDDFAVISQAILCDRMICREWDQEQILCLRTPTTATSPKTLLWTKDTTITQRPLREHF